VRRASGAAGIAMPASPLGARLYYNVTLVECESADLLDEILASPAFARLVVRQLTDRAILIDGRHKTRISRALARRGQSYRVVDGPTLPLDCNEGAT